MKGLYWKNIYYIIAIAYTKRELNDKIGMQVGGVSYHRPHKCGRVSMM